MCNDMLHATCYILATHAHTTPTAEDGRRWHRERVEGWCAPKDDHSGAARVEHWHAPDTKTTYTKKVHHGKAQTQDLHLKLSPYTRNYHLILAPCTITLYSHLLLSPRTLRPQSRGLMRCKQQKHTTKAYTKWCTRWTNTICSQVRYGLVDLHLHSSHLHSSQVNSSPSQDAQVSFLCTSLSFLCTSSSCVSSSSCVHPCLSCVHPCLSCVHP